MKNSKIKKDTTATFIMEEKEVDILGCGIGCLTPEQKSSIGVFTGQTNTTLVHGRKYYKVKNRYNPSTKSPQSEEWIEEHYPKELTTLEGLYKEFCRRAYDHISCHRSLVGSDMPSKIIFPDFCYEIIPVKLPIE